MHAFQTAAQSRDTNGLIDLLLTYTHAQRAALVGALPPTIINTNAGCLFRALGLHTTPSPLSTPAPTHGIPATLSPLKALCILLKTDNINVSSLLSLFRGALHASLPLAPPRQIGPLTYANRGFRPGSHYTWTHNATFELRHPPPPPYANYAKLIPATLALIPCSKTRALLQRCVSRHGATTPPNHIKNTFITLRLCTRGQLPLELALMIVSLMPPKLDYSVCALSTH